MDIAVTLAEKCRICKKRKNENPAANFFKVKTHPFPTPFHPPSMACLIIYKNLYLFYFSLCSAIGNCFSHETVKITEKISLPYINNLNFFSFLFFALSNIFSHDFIGVNIDEIAFVFSFFSFHFFFQSNGKKWREFYNKVEQ